MPSSQGFPTYSFPPWCIQVYHLRHSPYLHILASVVCEKGVARTAATYALYTTGSPVKVSLCKTFWKTLAARKQMGKNQCTENTAPSWNQKVLGGAILWIKGCITTSYLADVYLLPGSLVTKLQKDMERLARSCYTAQRKHKMKQASCTRAKTGHPQDFISMCGYKYCLMKLKFFLTVRITIFLSLDIMKRGYSQMIFGDKIEEK